MPARKKPAAEPKYTMPPVVTTYPDEKFYTRKDRPYSNQDILNHVWDTFVAKGSRRAQQISGQCRYRLSDNPEHPGCAIGCIMPDALYNPKMEGRGIINILESHEFPTLNVWLERVDWNFLDQLQQAHDLSLPYSAEDQFSSVMAERLTDLAKRFNLQLPAY